ncbi:MAG TPA: VIT domain-containing protein [Thermoanaerobaculia bacterium]|jgi:Ca-activated chloride channel family protein|nr:VIT domain-containing protein [Thermoanaerobaculia bacterium]
MNRFCKAVFLIFGLALLVVRPGAAADTTPDRTLSPYFFVENGDPAVDRLPLKETRADVHIAGVIADVLVTQVYRNEGSRPLNARYVFPASTRAAVHGMTMVVGDQRIRAKIREKQAAKREFEAAREAGKSAALLEQQRPNVFTMNVANVLPQDEIRVELHYSEMLVPTEGIYEFVYPTVVGPRYSKEPETEVQSSYLHQNEAPVSKFEIETRIAAGMPVDELLCPSHRTRVDWEDGDTARVRLDPGETNGGNRDYILRYRLQGKQVQTGLLLYPGQPGQDENFFLLMVQPPRRVEPRQIPPREYIFVLDVSGSMNGFPLDTAKTLMRELIGGLRPRDSFNIILFAGGSRLLAPRSLPATAKNVQEAIAEIEREQGGGGTELGAALDQAMALPETKGVSRSTIVVTDGLIDAEAAVFEQIRTRLNRSNLFAFGIGSSVNRHLIEGLAHAGQGEPFVVTEPAEAQAIAKSFQDYVRSPVLTHVAVEPTDFEAYDVEPLSVPDLFADRPLVVFGKWRGKPSGTIRVTGLGGEGQYEKVFDVAEAEPAADNQALRYLWARARVARLSDYGADDSDDTRNAVTALGLKYEMLTAYTSFVAIHEKVRNADDPAQAVEQPLPMPQGVSDLAVPEPELPLLVALVLLLLGLATTRRAWLR